MAAIQHLNLVAYRGVGEPNGKTDRPALTSCGAGLFVGRCTQTAGQPHAGRQGILAKQRGWQKTTIILGALALIYWVLLVLVSLPWASAPIAFLRPSVVLSGVPLLAFGVRHLWQTARHETTDLAYRDYLTAVGNRRAFAIDAGQRLRHAKAGSLALIILDVDGLKVLNDACGHLSGDELIIRFAQRLQAVAAPGAAYRIGGDEFALVVDRANGESATSLLGPLTAFEERFASCGHAHVIRASYGIASNNAGESFDRLFQRADLRLRETKKRLYESRDLAGRRSTDVIEDEPVPEQAAEAPSTISSLEERRRARNDSRLSQSG